VLEGQCDRHIARLAFARRSVNVQAFCRMPAWLDRSCIIVPAYQAAATLERVVEELRLAIPERRHAVLVVDDGSSDETGAVAARLGCIVVSHGRNRGKGAALSTGFATARARGWDIALTVDADGQHPADEARRVLLAADDPETLVLGVRDLERAGAPKKNRFSNGISNHFLSRFARRSLRDTQCGLRRYPIAATLALGTRGEGYDFEAEVLLRAIWGGMTVVEEPIGVLYPEDRVTHFHVVRDPWRIIRAVVGALFERGVRRPPSDPAQRQKS
jgi:glycosyltransferase involved in cell wall biosynthesis